jgi:hypothetical protein
MANWRLIGTTLSRRAYDGTVLAKLPLADGGRDPGSSSYDIGNSQIWHPTLGYALAACAGGVYKSTDGINWQIIATNAAGQMYGSLTKIYIDPVTDDFILCDQANTRIVQFDGTTWTQYTKAASYQFLGVRVSTQLYVFATTSGYAYRNTNLVSATDDNTYIGHSTKDFIYALSNWLSITGNTIRYSNNATTWNSATPTGVTDGYALATNGTTVVCVGNGISSATSVTVWTSRTPGDFGTAALRCVIWAGGTLNLWVAAGNNGVIYTSSDAATWTARVSNTNSHFTKLTFNTTSNKVVAYTSTTLPYAVIESSNGTTWTPVTPVRVGREAVVGLTYSSTLDRVVMLTQKGNVWTSGDKGATWVARTNAARYAPSMPTTWVGRDVLWANNLFVMVLSHAIATSTDGLTWTVRLTLTATTPSFDSIAYGGGRWLVAGATSTVLYSSTDGTTWTLEAALPVSAQQKLIYDTTNTRFVYANTGTYYSSTNGVSWASAGSGSNTIYVNGAAYAPSTGVYVVTIGTPGRLAYGTIGTTFTSHYTYVAGQSQLSDTLDSYYYVYWISELSKFIACGDRCVALINADVSTVTRVELSFPTTITHIVYAAGTLIGVSNDGIIFSTDGGSTWSSSLYQSGDLVVVGCAYRPCVVNAEEFSLPTGWQHTTPPQLGGNELTTGTQLANAFLAYIVRGSSDPNLEFYRNTSLGGNQVEALTAVYRLEA